MYTIVSVSVCGASLTYHTAYNASATINAFLADHNATDAVYQLLVEAAATDSISNEGQMRAAGFAEGYLTAELIQLHFDIVRQTLNLSLYENVAKTYLKTLAESTDFAIFSAYIDGMVSGYACRAQELNLTVRYTAADFLTILGAADYNEMYYVFKNANYSTEQRGTAVVKRIGNSTYIGGVLNSNYSTGGMRMLKTYTLRLRYLNYETSSGSSWKSADRHSTSNKHFGAENAFETDMDLYADREQKLDNRLNGSKNFDANSRSKTDGDRKASNDSSRGRDTLLKAASAQDYHVYQISFSAFPGLFGPLETVFQVTVTHNNGTVAASYAAAAQRYPVHNQSILKQIAIWNSADSESNTAAPATATVTTNNSKVLSQLRAMRAFLSASDAFAAAEQFYRGNNWAFAGGIIICNGGIAAYTHSQTSPNPAGVATQTCELTEYCLETAKTRAVLLKSDKYALLQNAPLDKELSEALGYCEGCGERSCESFNSTARFRICEEFLSGITAKNQLARFLQFNDYTSHNNLQHEDPCDAIAPRCDLSASYLQFGAVDFKIVELQDNQGVQFNTGASVGYNEYYAEYNAKAHNNSFTGLHDVLPNARSRFFYCIGSSYLQFCGECQKNFAYASACTRCVRSAWLVGSQCYQTKLAEIACAAAAVGAAVMIVLVVYIFERKRCVQSVLQV